MNPILHFRKPATAIQVEQVRLLYSSASFGYLATAFNAVLLALVLWAVSSQTIIVLWLVSTLAFTGLRLALVRKFHRVQPGPERIAVWGNLFGAGAVLSGIGWGAAGFFLFPESSTAHQVFLALVLAGMIAGAVGLMGPRLGVFLGFTVPAALPIALRLLTIGGGAAPAMAGMAVLFTGLMALTAWKFNKVMVSSLQLRFANADLLATLTGEKAMVDALNAKLTAEIKERQLVEVDLRNARVELEEKVKERTGQLEAAAKQLRGEMEVSRRLDQQLQQAQKMETVGRLAGGVAHDFNNLLTVMLGYAEMARSFQDNPGKLDNCLEGIHTAAQRAANLTKQLLAFSRRQLVNPEAINLNELLLGMAPLLRRVISESVELVILPGSDLWTTWADRREIERVVMNLVVNARDAMSHGGKLTVSAGNLVLSQSDASAFPEVAPGEYVLLAVQDTGVGIPDEIKSHIFEPFFTTKGVGQGTGLGLSSCYGIVAQAGGFMTVESAVGAGTTMRAFLPKKEMVAGHVETEGARDDLPRGSETILVAEDEANIRSLVSQVLQEHGYQVIQAMNGAEALTVFNQCLNGQDRNDGIDLLITDIVMPQMGGVELANQVRSQRPDLPILFMSGYAEGVDMDKIKSIGPSC
ncbi:MAG: response regulator [SAR202 cluster bacterium]|nr:response regulator [SAR202 cluster bacterium]